MSVATVASSHDAIAACAVGVGRLAAWSWWSSRRARSVVVVVAAVVLRGDSDGTSASTGRNRSSAVLPTSAIGLVAVLHTREVDDDVVALAADLGLGDAEAVDPVADDVDGDVERCRRVNSPTGDRHRDAALEVEAERRARGRRRERARRTCRRRGPA